MESIRYTGANMSSVETFIDADVEWRGDHLIVPTVQGPLKAKIGSWIVKRGDLIEVLDSKPKDE